MAAKKSTTRRNKKSSKKRSYVKRRSEVYGIVIIAVAIIIFLSFLSFSSQGVITSRLNEYLSYAFGLTKYIVPFLILVWGISFFIKRVQFLPSRFGWGFILLYISISGLLGNNPDVERVFDEVLIKSKGGIIGAGIFYGLFRLLTRPGAITVLIIILLISILIITRISLIEIIKKIARYISRKRVEIKDRSHPADADKRQIRVIGEEKKQRESRYTAKETKTVKPPPVVDNTKRQEKDKKQYKKEAPEVDKGKKKSGSMQLEMPVVAEKKDYPNYKLPPKNLLKKSSTISAKLYKQNVKDNVGTLNKLFEDFNLPAKITSVTRGPSVTLYELMLSQGVRVQKLLSLEDDFCVALGSPDLRFLTPIPGKSAIGIEVPNKVRSIVTLGDIFKEDNSEITKELLAIPLGKNFSGEIKYISINNMPHILIGGATNSGKSSCINSILISLLMKVNPSQLKMILIDPKMVELSIYTGIPHLLSPVVTDPKKAASALSWAVEEMQNRFKLLVENNCKSIAEFNFMANKDRDGGYDIEPLPYILIVIDELADLMMVAASEVEDSICRLAQMARAVGIHLVIATQKPVVKILTGLIKTNVPSRISFKVTDFTDSRVILDHGGAEKLIGRGDMLYLSPNYSKPERLQGAFVTTHEIKLVTDYIKNQIKPDYNDDIKEKMEKKDEKLESEDELLYDALKEVVEFGHASASLLQRKLRLGYARAARIIDQLEEKNLISGYDGSKPREVLISREDLQRILEEHSSK